MKCPLHPRYETKPFCPDCRANKERALQSLQGVELPEPHAWEWDLEGRIGWQHEDPKHYAYTKPYKFTALYTADQLRTAVAAAMARGAVPQSEPCRPDILERLTYHALERDDLTLDECLAYLAEGWSTVHGRTERQMVMQILALLTAAPTPEATQPTQAEAPGNPHRGTLRVYWQDGFDGKDLGGGSESQVRAWQDGRKARAALATQQAGQGEPEVIQDEVVRAGLRAWTDRADHGARVAITHMYRVMRLALTNATPPAPQQPEALAQGWAPTPENINRLPPAVRSYIHELEANADPAGNVRNLTIARDTVRALESSNRALRDLDTPGNRHPEFRFAGYAGEPLPEPYTSDQHAAYDEGVRARSAIRTPPAPQQAEALAQQERDFMDESVSPAEREAIARLHRKVRR